MAIAHQDSGGPPTREGKLKRDVGLIGLLFAGVGSIIGSGWLLGGLKASKDAGPAGVISWALATVMILLIGLCFAELGTMFPISGGVVRFPHLAFGSFASYSMGWITWLACVSVAPIEVEAALQYATGYIPDNSSFVLMQASQVDGESVYTLTGIGGVVAILLMALFVIVNYLGVKYFAAINNVLVWWKLLVIVAVIVILLVLAGGSGHFGQNFTQYGFMPKGWEGVFSAISTAGITFSFLGFRQGVELAGETSNPKRNVPFAVIGSVVICGILYILLQIAFTGSVSPSDLAKSGGWANLKFLNDAGPLAAIAQTFGLVWLAVVLYVDSVVSPADTGFAYSAVTARVSYAMGRNGNAPSSLAKVDRNRGVPWVSLLLAFIFGLVFFLPFPSWQQLVGFITSATVLSFGSGPLVLAVLRRKIPNYKRTFRLPGGDIIPFLAFFSSNMIVFWAGWSTNAKLFVAVLIGFVLLPIFMATAKVKHPPLKMRNGWWVIPWLGGLALISYLGVYDGGLSVLSLFWGTVATLVLSILIYVAALRTGMSTVEIEDAIGDANRESEEEVAVLGAE